MMRVIPNSGIMGDDGLDSLRSDAVLAAHDSPLPEEVVTYLDALERRYADHLNDRRRRALSEVAWTRKEPTHDQ